MREGKGKGEKSDEKLGRFMEGCVRVCMETKSVLRSRIRR